MNEKKVIFVGPSKVALDGFDYSILDEYDYVARTNLFLDSGDGVIEHDLTIHDRCDIIYLNKFAFNLYMARDDLSILKNKIVLVKFDEHQEALQNILPNTTIFSAQKEREQFIRANGCEPYSGTSLIMYLINNYKEVSIAGIDFYESGVGRNAKYINGYYSYNQSEGEESVHDMKKDICYLNDLIQNNSVKLIGKTKDAYGRLVKRCTL